MGKLLIHRSHVARTVDICSINFTGPFKKSLCEGSLFAEQRIHTL